LANGLRKFDAPPEAGREEIFPNAGLQVPALIRDFVGAIVCDANH
jgi:hypothetical protein